MENELIETLQEALVMLANNGGWGKTELMERIAGLIKKGSSLQQGVMVSVPRAPTEEMIVAGMEKSVAARPSVDDESYVLGIYKSMLAAAPSAQNAGPISREELLGAIARGWTHPGNAHKEMDSDLAESINIEVRGLLEGWERAGVAPSAEGENRSAIERAEKHGG